MKPTDRNVDIHDSIKQSITELARMLSENPCENSPNGSRQGYLSDMREEAISFSILCKLQNEYGYKYCLPEMPLKKLLRSKQRGQNNNRCDAYAYDPQNDEDFIIEVKKGGYGTEDLKYQGAFVLKVLEDIGKLLSLGQQTRRRLISIAIWSMREGTEFTNDCGNRCMTRTDRLKKRDCIGWYSNKTAAGRAWQNYPFGGDTNTQLNWLGKQLRSIASRCTGWEKITCGDDRSSYLLIISEFCR